MLVGCERRKAYSKLVKNRLVMPQTVRPRRRWEYDIKMRLAEGGCEDGIWMKLAHDRN
jgi:hypothetical protein